MSTQATLTKNTGMALKGGMFTLTAIQLLDDNLETLSSQLDEKIMQAPNFFQYAPIILDFQHFRLPDIDLSALIDTVRAKKLIPVGIRGATKELKEKAIQIGMAIFPEERMVLQKKRPSAPEKAETTLFQTNRLEATSPSNGSASSSSTRVITQPVRSGQQIYAPGGDLIVLAAVSHGAELLADGHIHVYGSMRGRALAGVMGDNDAMIFCKSLEAELISIAGQYRLSEDLKEGFWKESVCIQLQEGRLNIRPV